MGDKLFIYSWHGVDVSDDAARLVQNPPSPAMLCKIGEVTADPGMLLRTDGRHSVIERRGFDHFR